MKDTATYLSVKANSFPVSEVFSSHDEDKMERVEEDGLLDDVNVNSFPISEVINICGDDKMEHVEQDALLEGVAASQDKSKKKEKYEGGLPSLRRILTFDTVELSKLDEQKAEMKDDGVVKALSKSASFPSNAINFKKNCAHVEGSGDSEDSRECAMLSSSFEKSSVLAQVNSFPLKSALRGGYEELGKGPRPKLQVTWAPTVWEPPCSIISHTLNRSRSRKDSKHAKKGKYDAHKRKGKKKHHKSKFDGGSSNTVRRHASCYNEGGKEAENTCQGDNDQNFSTSGGGHLMARQSGSESEEMDSSKAICGSETSKGGGDMADGMGLTPYMESNARCGVHCPLESTCGASLFEPERVACNFLHRQAM